MSAVTVDANVKDQTRIDNARVERSRAIWWTIENIALSVWLGGLLVIGAIVAPTAFHAMRSAPVLAGNTLLQNTMAGSVVGGSLKVLNWISLFCMFLIAPIRVNSTWKPSFQYPRWVSILWYIIGFILLWQINVLGVMDSAQARGHMTTFDDNHHIYVDLTYMEIIALTIFAYGLNIGRANTLKP